MFKLMINKHCLYDMLNLIAISLYNTEIMPNTLNPMNNELFQIRHWDLTDCEIYYFYYNVNNVNIGQINTNNYFYKISHTEST